MAQQGCNWKVHTLHLKAYPLVGRLHMSHFDCPCLTATYFSKIRTVNEQWGREMRDER